MSDRYAKENYLHNSWNLERRRGHIYNTLLSEHLDLLEGNTLMLGCNTGSTMELIGEKSGKGATLDGIDINDEAVHISRKAGLSVLCVDVLDMSIEYRDAFDTIIAFDFIEHIYPSDMPKLIMECHRVLKPHGKVFAFSPRTDPERPSQAAMDSCHVQFFTSMLEFSSQWKKMFDINHWWHDTRENPSGIGKHDAYAMILESRKCAQITRKGGQSCE